MAHASWYIDGHILRRLVAAEENGISGPELLEVAEQAIADLQIDELRGRRAVARLADAGFIEVVTFGWDEDLARDYVGEIQHVRPSGLQAASAWPSSSQFDIDQLVGAIQMVASMLTDDEDDKARLDRIIEWLEGLDKHTIAQLVIAIGMHTA